jgi:ribosome-associated protein
MSKLESILNILDEKKAENIVLIDLRSVDLIHEDMLIASVSNIRLLDAIKDYLMDGLTQKGFSIHHVEGTAESEWILIDIHDIVVHLFLESTRDHYQLDRLWADKKVNIGK